MLRAYAIKTYLGLGIHNLAILILQGGSKPQLHGARKDDPRYSTWAILLMVILSLFETSRLRKTSRMITWNRDTVHDNKDIIVKNSDMANLPQSGGICDLRMQDEDEGSRQGWCLDVNIESRFRGVISLVSKAYVVLLTDWPDLHLPWGLVQLLVQ